MDRSLYAQDRVCVEPSAGVPRWGFSDGGSSNPHALAKYLDIVDCMTEYLPNFTILEHDPQGFTWRGRTLACAWRMHRYVQYFDASFHKYLWYLDGMWTQVPSCETLDYYGTMAQTESPARNLLCPSLFRRTSAKSSTIRPLFPRLHTFCLIGAIATAARVEIKFIQAPTPDHSVRSDLLPFHALFGVHLYASSLHVQMSCVHSAFARRGSRASSQLIKSCRPQTLELFIRSCQLHETMNTNSSTISNDSQPDTDSYQDNLYDRGGRKANVVIFFLSL